MMQGFHARPIFRSTRTGHSAARKHRTGAFSTAVNGQGIARLQVADCCGQPPARVLDARLWFARHRLCCTAEM